MVEAEVSMAARTSPALALAFVVHHHEFLDIVEAIAAIDAWKIKPVTGGQQPRGT
jgi:hypothetical protein